ncbi:glycerophosphodiester phosphodiesterase [Natronosporangium hydrolyticum]|uniref:Glycerophosphodiester phosphodiesterase n=1 Tax=Natronosporangium hydrolyticum TaxID=2811111 RepID=A0A895YQJ5_9ACTN|nr:glycerophosphodiester phosphodiesterase family protein [Natronosporangium hydrolyticum]QSB16268.1 glycerophosphodiester phosphodiesterase [Natronosporangium hydrolyticum]
MGNRFGYLDAPLPLAIAHRGGAASAVENTAAAFARAVELGYRYLETDVRATRDEVAVLCHDATLERVAGRAVAVSELSWSELATIRVDGGAAVPRLAEMLDAWPSARFNLDVKSDAAVAPTAAVLARGAAPGQVLLASFSDRRLSVLRRLLGPAVPTSLGRGAVTRLRLAAVVGRSGGRPRWLPESAVAAQVPVRAYGVPVVDRRFVRHAHRLGQQVHVWTVDDPAMVHRLLDLGVDGIMTDRLEMLRDVYRARGCWWPG